MGASDRPPGAPPGRLKHAVDGRLVQDDRGPGHPGQPLGKVGTAGEQLVRLFDLEDEPDRGSPPGVDDLAGQHQVLRPRGADERNDLGRARVPYAAFDEAEAGSFGGDHEVEQRGQPDPGTEHKAVHGGDARFADAPDPCVQRVEVVDEGLVAEGRLDARHAGHVAPRAERPARRADQDRPDLGVRVGLFHGFR